MMVCLSCISFLLNEYVLLTGVLIFFAYKWSIRNYQYFFDRGVVYDQPLPFVGNFGTLMCGMENMYTLTERLYKKFKNQKFFGMYEMRRPVLFISDPEVVKQVAVKDFEHFLDHRAGVSDIEPIFAKNLLALTGQKWKNMRATLSPVFTGSKMREMFELITECAEKVTQHLLLESKGSNPLVVENKDLSTRFSNDVIASTAFGLQVDSLKDKENGFYMMGKTVTTLGPMAAIKLFLIISLPTVAKFFKIRVSSKETTDKFSKIVLDTIAHRQKNNIVRRDVIQLLMQARDGSLQHNEIEKQDEGFATVQESSVGMSSARSDLSDDDLIAQCMIFFFAGFETSSVLICFCIQELIENRNIQEKLYNEIREVEIELDGKSMTYEVLQKMKYLDMVISETLRKWPPGPATDRVCTKPYEFDNNGRTFRFEVGDMLMLPIYGFHRDPQYFPNPEKFDPERFSDQNKQNIKPFTYLPFGVGPRNCIGSRFALMECKAFIYYLLTKFSFEASEKTQIPIKLLTKSISMKAEKGFWVHYKPRG